MFEDQIYGAKLNCQTIVVLSIIGHVGESHRACWLADN